MNRHSIKRGWLTATVVATVASGMSGTGAWAQDADDADDALTAGAVIPKKVNDLDGTPIASGNESNFVTIDRPEDMNRMFLLYNVGTGKFLNVGGYWGTHAALSTVPRPFWLQHRSETRVKGVSSYMRYPENADEYKGTFAYDFFSLTTLQVGNTEGGKRAHVTYNYLRYVDETTGEKHDIIPEGTVSDGGSFMKEIKDFDFHKYRIEAQIDMSRCTATQSGGGNMETLLSFGKDVSMWSYGVSDLHIYGFRSGGKSYIRVQPLDSKYGDAAYKSGGDENPIEIKDDNLVTITVSRLSVEINGVDCMPRNTYADSDNHIPEVPYSKDHAGQKVLFRTDADGNFLLDKNNKYIIAKDNESGKPDLVTNTFLYSGDDLTDEEKQAALPFFLTSRFVKGQSSSRNEGSYMTWCPYDDQSTKYGTVGVFGDRALPYSTSVEVQKVLDYSRWFFEPVEGSTQNLYRMYIEATDLETIDNPGAEPTKHEGEHRFYLQATDNYVYGNNNEGYAGNPTINDLTNVDALPSKPEGGQGANGYWKVISMTEYYRLFENPSSEFTSMLDLSFLLSDPNFIAENGKLTEWMMEKGLEKHVRIGYDQFSKKNVTDTDYTDDEGKRDKSHLDNGIVVWDETGSDQWRTAKSRKITHGRYMGVDVKGEGTGRFYQDVTVDKAGWYAISCGGMSNAGAALFIQVLDKAGNPSAPTERALHALTPEEKAWYDKAGDKTWPYDQIDATHGMPMYNALVAINDENATNGYLADAKQLVDRYNTQVSFFVDPNVLSDNGGSLTLRFGINVPAVATQAEDDSETSTTPVATSDRWTVFDNFHLAFGGYALEPNLILSEDSTNLDYINRANHVFSLRPMRLKRTFTGGVWNTLVLPVSLSASDFHTLFGQEAQLAQLDHLTANTVEFTSVKTENENDELLKAFKPYIIKVQEGYEEGKVDTAYTARLANREDGGKTLYTVTIPEKHYYLEHATLQGFKTDDAQQTYYDFQPADYLCKDNVLAKDESGTNTPLRAYGTLCKNYVDHSVIEGRPDLSGAYVMAGGNMRKLKGPYGTRGFRCWFVPESGDAQQTDINGVKVVIDGSDTGTGIADLVEADGGIYLGGYAGGVYTLGGQLVRRGNSLDGLPAGIYIVNGLKYVVR